MSYAIDNSEDFVRLECVLCGSLHVANVNEGVEFDCPECDEEGTLEICREFENT